MMKRIFVYLLSLFATTIWGQNFNQLVDQPLAQSIEAISQYLTKIGATEIVEKTDYQLYTFGFRLVQQESKQRPVYLSFVNQTNAPNISYSLWGIKLEEIDTQTTQVYIKLLGASNANNLSSAGNIQSSGKFEENIISFIRSFNPEQKIQEEQQKALELVKNSTTKEKPTTAIEEEPKEIEYVKEENEDNKELIAQDDLIDPLEVIEEYTPIKEKETQVPEKTTIKKERNEKGIFIDFQSICRELNENNEEKAFEMAKQYYLQSKTIPFRRQAFDYDRQVFIQPKYGSTGQDIETIGQLIVASLAFSNYVDNIDMSIRWYKKAADNNNVEAMMNLADYFQINLDPSIELFNKAPNAQQELYWLEKANSYGYLEANQLLKIRKK